jgi:hypothetical protein
MLVLYFLKLRSGMPAAVQSAEPTVYLQRGARGFIDGRSRAGKLITAAEKELLAALPGPPTPAQKLAIRRVARLAWAAEESDTRLHQALVEGRVSEATLRNMTETNRAIAQCIRELDPLALANGRGTTGPETLAEYLAKAASP